jgi:hypothetical protein
MALETVDKYVAFVRELLQDEKDTPYRYSNASIVRALSIAMMEAKKIRPDLFINISTTQDFTTADITAQTVVVWNEMYRLALAYFTVGMMQLRDDEEVQDQRAAAFMSMATAKLTTVS